MKPRNRTPRGAIATRNGRPAYLAPIVRARQPVPNRDWFNQRRHQTGADIFETLFAKLLAKVKG